MAALSSEIGGTVLPLLAADLYGLPAPQILSGSDGNDTLVGGAGDDVLCGGGGNDVLDGGAGNNVLDGGEGRDSVTYQRAASGVVVDLSVGIALADGLDQLISIENVVGSAFGDYLRGDGGNNWLMGWDGDDLIVGNGGNDTLSGGLGDDTLIGGAGFDWVSYAHAGSGVIVNLATGTAVGEGNDLLHDIEAIAGSRFADHLTGNAANNWFEGGGGDDTIDGGAGNDTVSYATAPGGVNVDLATGIATGHGTDTLRNIETVVGSGFDDILGGDDFGNLLMGGAGDDFLYGRGGNDTLQGGAGNDTLDGGEGFDVANFANSAAGIRASLVTGTATGDGFDTLISIEGLFGSAHDDVLIGDAGNNWLWGEAGNDILFGGAGHDQLRGGSGNDTLVGGAGRDVLEGGSGADLFVFAVGSGKDVIRDFTVGTDQIGVYGFAIGTFEELSARFVQVGADTTIHFSASDQVTLVGVDAASLTAADFHIALAMPPELLALPF